MRTHAMRRLPVVDGGRRSAWCRSGSRRGAKIHRLGARGTSGAPLGMRGRSAQGRPRQADVSRRPGGARSRGWVQGGWWRAHGTVGAHPLGRYGIAPVTSVSSMT